MAQPIIKVRNGTLEIAVFESTVDSQYGSRSKYQFSVTKSVKNEQTGEWDRTRVSLYDNQVLELAELLSVAHRQLVAYKNKPSDVANPVATQADDEIPF